MMGEGQRLVSGTRRAVCWLVVALLAGAAGRAGAAEAWARVQSEHFTLVGDAAVRDMRVVAQRFERFRGAFERVLPNTGALDPVPTVIVVFASDRAMRPFKPVEQGRVREHEDALFVAGGDVNYILLKANAGRDDYARIYDAYSSHLLRSSVAGVPLWIARGVATYFATFEVSSGGKAATLGRVPDRVAFRLRDHSLPLADIVGAGETSPLYRGGAERDAYDALSWASVHFVLNAMNGGSEGLSRYLGLVSTGTGAAAAFQPSFGLDVAEFDARVRDYVARAAFKTRSAPLEAGPDTAEGEAEPLTAAAVDARLADVQLHLDRPAEAEALVTRALEADAELADAYFTRGMLRLRQQRPADAWPDLERAAQALGGSYGAQFAFARLALAPYVETPAPAVDRTRVEKARDALVKATTLDREAAEASFMLAYASMLLDQPEAARRAAERAIELAPTRESYRLLLARLALVQRDTAGARRAIGTLAARAAEPDTQARARALLGEIAELEGRIREEELAREKSRAAAEAAEAAAAAQRATRSGYDLQLREVLPGETRAFGVVTAIDCRAKGVVMQGTLDGREMRLFAPGLDRLEIITYRDAGGSVACGPQTELVHLYVTWRPATPEMVKAISGADGEVVAIELLPRDYEP